ncbi:MAG: molybdenum cofactor guanylyltransferase [Planctomycetes bacterium]|nr:molybdenum cofactor guanylyltransferase [Planctomycetota bacterium]
MGSDKATLAHSDSGKTWLERALATLALAGASQLLVAGGDPAWVPSHAEYVPDRRPGQGPLAGIEAAIERGVGAGRGPWWVVLACDLPLLRAETIHELLAARRPGAVAVVPRSASGLEPLVACYHERSLGPLVTFLEGGRRSARAFVSSLAGALSDLPDVVALDLSCAEELFNANTPDDLRELPTGPDSQPPDSQPPDSQPPDSQPPDSQPPDSPA